VETAADLVFTQLGVGSQAVPYLAGWQLQRRMHERRVGDQIPDSCLLLEHEPVYTAGKRTGVLDRPIGDPGAPVIDVDRGGKITWHGPGQLVGYPIIRLPDPIDVVAHVRAIEEALIRTCAEFGVVTGRVHGRSGVWVTGGAPAPGTAPPVTTAAPDTWAPPDSNAPPDGNVAQDSNVAQDGNAVARDGKAAPDRKVAAIGIRVARGVTMHGFALNCDCDLSWFDRIVPCGIRDAQVTTLSAEAGRTIGVTDVIPLVQRHLADALGASGWHVAQGADTLLTPALAASPPLATT